MPTLLRLRENPNFMLTTVLWGNVGINVLLTLLSNSILTGVSTFLFSTMLITFAGENTESFQSKGTSHHDDIIEQDIVLLWGAHKRIITGADILGRLMRGISTKELSF